MSDKQKDKTPFSLIEQRWKRVQRHLGFTDEELATFRSNPSHVKAMEEAKGFATMRMVIEVMEARNCAAGYKTGDKFVVDSEGFLVRDECPPMLCVGAIYSFKTLVDRMWQAFFNNSTEVLHDTVHCPDVGVHKGGAGMVMLRIHAELKAKEQHIDPTKGKD
jgi:uncharacterized repeat protein (TIGR04076 family)